MTYGTVWELTRGIPGDGDHSIYTAPWDAVVAHITSAAKNDVVDAIGGRSIMWEIVSRQITNGIMER